MKNLFLFILLVLIAACGVAASKANAAKQATAWSFRGASVDSVAAQLKPGSVLIFKMIDGQMWVQVDGNKPLDESHPCPPFTDC